MNGYKLQVFNRIEFSIYIEYSITMKALTNFCYMYIQYFDRAEVSA
jgi:hypothetical protein